VGSAHREAAISNNHGACVLRRSALSLQQVLAGEQTILPSASSQSLRAHPVRRCSEKDTGLQGGQQGLRRNRRCRRCQMERGDIFAKKNCSRTLL